MNLVLFLDEIKVDNGIMMFSWTCYNNNMVFKAALIQNGSNKIDSKVYRYCSKIEDQFLHADILTTCFEPFMKFLNKLYESTKDVPNLIDWDNEFSVTQFAKQLTLITNIAFRRCLSIKNNLEYPHLKGHDECILTPSQH